MMDIDISVKDEVSPALAMLIDALEGETLSDLNAVGGRSANTAAIEYHDQFNQAGGWRGTRYIDGPGRNPGDFGQNVALGWNFQRSDKSGATISNNADYYAFKVTGGTIVPKRVKNLTIPLVADAMGRRAADYVSLTGHRLFTIPGKNALFKAEEGGGVTAIYALVKKAVLKPWPNALPDEGTISDAFVDGWEDGLYDLLEEL
jgi:hypothetical protein